MIKYKYLTYIHKSFNTVCTIKYAYLLDFTILDKYLDISTCPDAELFISIKYNHKKPCIANFVQHFAEYSKDVIIL